MKKNKHFHQSITTDVSIEEAFEKIRSPHQWWTVHFKGKSKRLNDTFTLRFGENKFRFKVVEMVPDQKLVWLTIHSFMPWLKDRSEWTGTKIVFEFSKTKNRTKIDLTHIGLVPVIECYGVCKVGWNQYFGESIPALLSKGTGIFFDD